MAVSGRISSHFAVQNHSTKPCSNAVQVMEVLETRHHQVLFGNQVTWLYGYFILPHRSNPWRPDHRPLLLELPVLAPPADITRDTTSTSTADSVRVLCACACGVPCDVCEEPQHEWTLLQALRFAVSLTLLAQLIFIHNDNFHSWCLEEQDIHTRWGICDPHYPFIHVCLSQTNPLSFSFSSS